MRSKTTRTTRFGGEGADSMIRKKVIIGIACFGAYAFQSAAADAIVYAISKVQAEEDGTKQEIKDARGKASKAKAEHDALVQDLQKIKAEFDGLEVRYHNAV